MVTLGISTNTRLVGLALINPENSLVDYSIHLYKSSWSPSKANMIITSSLEPCVRQYCIKKVILSIPAPYHQSDAFKQLMARVKKYFVAKNIPICEKTVKDLHPFYPPRQKRTRKALMQALTLQFPQLTLCYHKELRNKNKYYFKVFEAVAVAALVNQGK